MGFKWSENMKVILELNYYFNFGSDDSAVHVWQPGGHMSPISPSSSTPT